MKTARQIAFGSILFMWCADLWGATTINTTNKYAYGANLGWMDWRGDTSNGAVVGEYVCSGYIYSANVGWINLGNGTPTNGIQYQNLSASDFGVNRDGLGNLRGFAYGANIGWINFETNGAAKVDLLTGRLSGAIYSANCGWISLSNAFAYVQTDAIAPGADTDGDGIADAWELTYTNSLTAFTGSSDTDGDGASDLNEYLAGTNPAEPADYLRITYVARGMVPGFTTLHWASVPTRFYTIQARPTVDTNSIWMDAIGFGLGASNSTFSTGNPEATEFYRIRANRPLAP